MSNTRKLWLGLGVLLVASFAVLLWSGGQIFRAAPPIPDRVVSQDGQVVYTRADIEQGRQVWQSIGGMDKQVQAPPSSSLRMGSAIPASRSDEDRVSDRTSRERVVESPCVRP